MKFFVGALVTLGIVGAVFMAVVWWRNQPPAGSTTADANLAMITPTIDDDPGIGTANAPVTIIAFEDFQCPYCAEAHPIIQQVLQKYPTQVLFVYRDFPLITVHPQALPAALAANCANEQGQFWQYHNSLFEQQDKLGQANIYQTIAQQLRLNLTQFNACVSTKKYQAEIEQDFDAGILAGVDSTPTWFVNGIKLKGVYSLAEWDQIIQSYIGQ